MTLARSQAEYVVAKQHVAGNTFRTVVMRRRTNEIVWRNEAVGWTKQRKAEAREWIETHA